MLSEIDPHKVEEIKLCVRNTGDIYREVQYLCSNPHKPTLALLRMVDKVAAQDCGFAITRYESCEIVIDLVEQYEHEKHFTTNDLALIKQRMKNRMARLEADGGTIHRKPKVVSVDARGHETTVAPDVADLFPKETEQQRQARKTLQFAVAYGASIDTITRTMQGADLQIQNLPKEPDMTKPIKIETKHFINGQDVSQLEAPALWALIATQEKALKDLKAIEAKPKSLIDHIAEVESGIAGLVAFLDSRDTKAA